jgi:uncharacterized protein
MLIYIHGFASSSFSKKALILQKHIKEFISIDLSHHPKIAMEQLEDLIKKHDNITLIGSSLGGYYATYLSEKYHLPAILINPSTQPFNTLKIYLNQEVQNYSKDEKFFFNEEDLENYRDFFKEKVTPSNYLLLLQKGDKSLNYQLAETKYFGASMIIEDEGSHDFDGFERMVKPIQNFIDNI